MKSMNLNIPVLKMQDLNIGFGHQNGQKEAVIYGPLNISITYTEMIGLIGRNGIGKSTLLRTIAGLQPALRGTIEIMGREIRKIHRTERATLISYVSTEIIQVQNLRVIDLVSMGRFPYTGWLGQLDHSDLHIIEESLELTQTRHLAHKLVQHLSDGERQKVMIARALAQDTPVIILDEPTAFLDLPARFETLRLLNELSRNKNKIILFSTHDLAIAMDEADMLWLMTDNGLLQGAPEDLLMNHGFRKLFGSTGLDFDNISGIFRYSRKPGKTVFIQADENLYPVTSKAMERIGYKVTSQEPAFCRVNAIFASGIPLWHLKTTDTQVSFNTIHDLTAFLRHV